MTDIYIITDTHFDHDKLISPFGRPAGFSEKIKTAWNRVVKPKDVVIHLGDIGGFRDVEGVHQKYIQDVPGRKILVKGNHDGQTDSWYLDHGWDHVCESFLKRYMGKNILFSHKPQKDLGYFDLNVHGHFHNTNHRLHEPQYKDILNEKHKLLALEYHGYAPMLLKTFVEKIASKESAAYLREKQSDQIRDAGEPWWTAAGLDAPKITL